MISPPDLKPKLQNPSLTKKKDKTMGRRDQFAWRLAFGLVLPMFLLKNPNAEHFENLPLSFFIWEKIEVPKPGTPQDPSSGAQTDRAQDSLLTVPFPWYLT